MRLRRCTLATAGLAILWPFVPARADDVTLVPGATVQVPGGRISGQIQAETPLAIQIKPATGAARDLPVEQVAEVTYSGQPASLPLAETREANGALPEALEQFKAAASQAADREFILQTAAFGQARVLARIAEAEPERAAEAIAALEGFLKQYPNSRHKGPALEWLARLSLATGDTARADTALAQLAALPWAATQAAILQARVLSRKGQHGQALEAIDKIIAALPKGAPRGPDARLVRAETLAAAGKYSEAEAAAREVIDSAPPEEVELQAHAHNTLGDCLRAAKKPKDALFAYLHTDILYDQDKEQHALALARIVELWKELKNNERADEVQARLKSLYPKSPLAKSTTP